MKKFNTWIDKHEDQIVTASCVGLVVGGVMIGYSLGAHVNQHQWRKFLKSMVRIIDDEGKAFLHHHPTNRWFEIVNHVPEVVEAIVD